jgi:hypothetical protein
VPQQDQEDLEEGNFVLLPAVTKDDPNAIAVAVAKPCYLLVRDESIVLAGGFLDCLSLFRHGFVSKLVI